MALERYLGGVGLIVLGLFIIFFGIAIGTFGQNSICCGLSVVIGFILLLIGGFYSRTADRLVPQKIDMMPKKTTSRYCPKCGREIPFDANICPYCGNDFKS